jgi:DDE superfamily endonuclease
MTFMAALRHDRITAPWFIEGPINGEAFLLYIEKVLVPPLRHGNIVIMDNLGSHKANAVMRFAVQHTLAHAPNWLVLPTRGQSTRLKSVQLRRMAATACGGTKTATSISGE